MIKTLYTSVVLYYVQNPIKFSLMVFSCFYLLIFGIFNFTLVTHLLGISINEVALPINLPINEVALPINEVALPINEVALPINEVALPINLPINEVKPRDGPFLTLVKYFYPKLGDILEKKIVQIECGQRRPTPSLLPPFYQKNATSAIPSFYQKNADSLIIPEIPRAPANIMAIPKLPAIENRTLLEEIKSFVLTNLKPIPAIEIVIPANPENIIPANPEIVIPANPEIPVIISEIPVISPELHHYHFNYDRNVHTRIPAAANLQIRSMFNDMLYIQAVGDPSKEHIYSPEQVNTVLKYGVSYITGSEEFLKKHPKFLQMPDSRQKLHVFSSYLVNFHTAFENLLLDLESQYKSEAKRIEAIYALNHDFLKQMTEVAKGSQ